MSKIRNWLNELTNTAKMITAISSACGVIIGLLAWITVKVTDISSDFKKAVSVVPIVEQNTRDIAEIRSTYVMGNKFDEHQKFIITEIDMMIDDTMQRISNKQYLGMKYVNRLIYYRDNLTFLSNKQKQLIDYIEKVADKQTYDRDNHVQSIDKIKII